jgi:hypothetical protein
MQVQRIVADRCCGCNRTATDWMRLVATLSGSRLDL